MQRYSPVLTNYSTGYGNSAIMEADLTGDYVHISNCPPRMLLTIIRYSPAICTLPYAQYATMVEDIDGDYVEFNYVG